ncbi:MAG: NADP-dependent oxidoreductase domain protein [Devosia sp.]|nr:NADP-dependent oxidoreductase domain protein [Devosia sp.]
MPTPSAKPSGSFSIGGDMPVTRLGFGAMRITGRGIWGNPADPEGARRTLRRIPELGIDFIDTADSYGPYVSEELIAETLYPYDNLIIATKGGLVRTGPDQWHQIGRPMYLRQQVHMSLRRLKLERLDLWQLHRIADDTPADEQFAEIASMQQEGLIRHIGLSEVSVDDIKGASRHFKVTTVQNRYNRDARGSDAVLDYCEANGIGFIPWAPLGSGGLARDGSKLEAVAKTYGATAGQIALAWLLKRSPVMLPIPGTGKVSHLEDNTAAASITLSDTDFAAIGG